MARPWVWVPLMAEGGLARLAALSPSARRDLLRVLLADPEVRADLIRQFYEREDARNLVEGLMDPEAYDGLRARRSGDGLRVLLQAALAVGALSREGRLAPGAGVEFALSH